MKFNYLRFLFVFIFSAWLVSGCQSSRKSSKERYTVLNGNIRNFDGHHFRFSYDTYGLLEDSRIKQVKIDSNGNFYLKMKLKYPIKGDFYFGREMLKGRGVNKFIYVYLNPGDSLYVTADVKVIPDTDRIKKTLSISGSAKKDNEFVNRFDFSFNSYNLIRLNNSTYIKELQPDEYKRTVDSVRDSKLNFIKKYSDTVKISPKLKRIYELEAINMADVRKFNYPLSHANFNQGKEAVLPDDYYSFASNVRVSDNLEEKGVPYLRSVHFFLQHKYELQKSSGYDGDYLSFINEQLKGRAKFIYMAYSLKSDFDVTIYNQFGNNCPYPDIKKIVKSRFGYMEGMLPGNPAPDFFLVDDKNVTLPSADLYTGPIIYIDFWATWCKPCIREFPYIATLEKEYQSENVKFISISFDEEMDNWIAYLKKNSVKDGQYWVGEKSKSAIKRTFNINMIPRFILLDGKGNIIDPNAPRPSSGVEIRKLLNTALGKS